MVDLPDGQRRRCSIADRVWLTALANLHNAQRARVPIVNIVGDQATYHRHFDAPLTADTEGWGGPVSVWMRTARSAKSVGADAAAAVQAARNARGIATLILPSDTSWNEGGVPAEPLPVTPPTSVTPATIAAVARVLRSGEPAILLMTGVALETDSLANAHRIAALTKARLIAPTFNRLIQRGRGRCPIELLPYQVDAAVAALGGVRHLILVGAGEPAGFFAYPGKPSLIAPEAAGLDKSCRRYGRGSGARQDARRVCRSPHRELQA